MTSDFIFACVNPACGFQTNDQGDVYHGPNATFCGPLVKTTKTGKLPRPRGEIEVECANAEAAIASAKREIEGKWRERYGRLPKETERDWDTRRADGDEGRVVVRLRGPITYKR